MTLRLSGKLNRLPIFTKPSPFLSFQLARFSRFFETLLSRFSFFKTLLPLRRSSPASYSGASMGDDYFSSSGSDDNNNLFELGFNNLHSSGSSSSASNQCHNVIFLNDDEEDANEVEKLYLVLLRWWRKVQHMSNHVGVSYNVASSYDDVEIELYLKRGDKTMENDDVEEGFSGREYALLSETMWLRALKWHNDLKSISKDVAYPSLAKDNDQDLFSLQIRLSVSGGANALFARINSKDNFFFSYRRACSLFAPKSEPLSIWDFSGQTTQLLINNQIKRPSALLRKSLEKEITLELQVHGFSEFLAEQDGKVDERVGYNNSSSFNYSGSIKTNGSSDWTVTYPTSTNSLAFFSGHRQVVFLGLKGMQNLGNTCFMNSAIQCLAHTSKLTDYFLDDYKKEINWENPLGMKGGLAVAFGDLLRKLWTPGSSSISPTIFKQRLATFAPQFSGYNQHDSQEFLAFLLDGLHEDLNRVKDKPYIEGKDSEGRPDVEVAEECWQNHMARNDSIIVDISQGQYRSTLVCPICKKSSITFDPFMYLSLPLPSTTMRKMTLTILGADGVCTPSPVVVTVPKCGRLKDLIDTLSSACSLRNDETLILAEIYNNTIFKIFDDPTRSLDSIRDNDTLVAYRLSKESESSKAPLVEFDHRREPEGFSYFQKPSPWSLFGTPLVARLSDISDGFSLHNLFMTLVNPFLKQVEVLLDDYDERVISNEDSGMEYAMSPTKCTEESDNETEDDGQHIIPDFRFYLDDKEIRMDDTFAVSDFSYSTIRVNVCWSEQMIAKYGSWLLNPLQKVFNPMEGSEESVPLYKCLESFLKEEPLGPDDMWLVDCPDCKMPRQATKKLDLWRLPEILIVHLKRFSYGRWFKNKLETYVDFPIDELDLSSYLSYDDGKHSKHYVLYAISNHYGGMGGGHYTAFVDHGHGNWYEFDDQRVLPISKEKIRSAAAYVLFYRRVT
ncbi:unnamed protein product [Linum tenue]|uniref:Ubiquitin carboxyl-terminal hydrolase n=1 Tax=Linum tenue TaxID=586396 RepID=A0AAV0IXA5_9ROSI|nr:unnamed protein product [Linum tenue]